MDLRGPRAERLKAEILEVVAAHDHQRPARLEMQSRLEGQIIKLLEEHGEMRRNKITETVGRSARSTDRALATLLEHGKVRRVGYGRYTLPEEQRW